MQHDAPQLDATKRLAFEVAYGALLPLLSVTTGDAGLHGTIRSAVVQLGERLGKPCPIPTRRERRGARVEA